MKKKTQLLSTLMIITFLLGIMVFPAHAETTDSLKAGNISWNLKKDKAVKYKTEFVMINSKGKKASKYKTGKVTIKNYKAWTDGDNKKATFTVVFDLPNKFTKSEILGYAKAYERGINVGDYTYVSLVDYNTGRCLEQTNTLGVIVQFGGWKHSRLKKFKGTGNSWYKFYQKASVTVSVTYPKTYKGLCLLAGGHVKTSTKDSSENGAKAFFEGKIPFKKCSTLYSKKDKTFNHGLRLK